MKLFTTIIFFAFLFVYCAESRSRKDEDKTIEAVENEPLITIASPASVGMDSTLLDSMTSAIVNNEFPNIHSVLVFKDSKLVYENYFTGVDEIRGTPIGRVKHGRDSLHDLRSVSKSVTGACIGLAIAQGKIKSEEQSVWDFFPEYASLKNKQNSSLTLKHLLTMTVGLEWNESVPYTDPKNSEIQMDESDDPIRFVLSRKVVDKPGTRFNYSGGATEVLAIIIKKSTGLNVEEFAKQYLFNPLHIEKHYWIKFDSTDPKRNVPAAASGLRLRSRDIAKFGLLYMHDGIVEGKQILPSIWIQNSHKTQIFHTDSSQGYGYHFWTSQNRIKDRTLHIAAAVGNGDQRIFFDKTNNLMVVVTAGNYNQWDIKNGSWQLVERFLYPSFLK